MSRGWIVAALLVVSALAFVLLREPTGASDDATPPAGATPLTAAGAAEDGRPSLPAAAAGDTVPSPLGLAEVAAPGATPRADEGAPLADGAATGAAWHGVVVGADGRPLAGARVARLPRLDANVVAQINHSFDGNPTLFADATWTVTAADGAFELPWAPPAAGQGWALLVREPEHMPLLTLCDGALASGGDVGGIALLAGGRVSGRVLVADGAPAADAQVELTLLPYTVQCVSGALPLIAGLREALLQTRTEVDGRFTLPGLPAADLSLQITAVGYAPLTPQTRTLAAGAELDLGELRLQEGSRITGRVLDADGAPIAGAEVRASLSSLESLRVARHAVHDELEWARHGKPGYEHIRGQAALPACVGSSDAEGRFTIGGLVVPRCGVLAVAPGFEPAAVADVAAGASGIELRLRRLGVLHVRVVDDADGAPLEDAELSLLRVFNGGGIVRGVSGALPLQRTGPAEFLATDVCDASLVALLESPRLGVAAVPCDGLQPGEREASRVLRVPRAASVEGVVRPSGGAGGAGLAAARVTLTPYDYADFRGAVGQLEFRTDESGRFRSGPIPAGHWSLAAFSAGRTTVQRELSLAPEQHLPDADLVLAQSATLQLLVLDRDGAPVNAAEVVVSDAGPDARPGVGVGFVRTDREGRAQCEVPAGLLRAEVRALHIVQELGLLAEGETRVVSLQVQRPATLQGTVAAGGAPLAAITVTFRRDNTTVRTTTDADGHYSLQVPGGLSGRLSARSPRGGLVVREVQPLPGAVLTLDLALGTGTLRARFVDGATGAGVAGVGVQVSPGEGQGYGTSVPSDADGRLQLGDLLDGEWLLVPYAKSITPIEPLRVTLPAAGAQELVISVVRTGSVSGVVRNAQGGTAATKHEVFLLEREGGLSADWSLHGDDGAFAFEGLAPGDYELCVTRGLDSHELLRDPERIRQLAWVRAAVRVSSGAETRQDLALPEGRP